jgi:hypothetical protein
MDRSPQVQLQGATLPMQNWVAIIIGVLERSGAAVSVGIGTSVGGNVEVAETVFVDGAV